MKREIMSRDPACWVLGDSAQAVAKMLYDRNIGSMPVMADQESRKLIGMITDRDLCCSVIAGPPSQPDRSQALSLPPWLLIAPPGTESSYYLIRAKPLSRAVPNVRRCRRSCAMGATKESPANFDSVADNPTFAVLANRGQGLDCTLKAVESVTSASSYQFETFVVFVSTNFTGRHINPL